MSEFENEMIKFTEIFHFYNFYKFKQILKEEEDKKSDNKKGGNKYTKYEI
jgi:hypothetical protein